jgi:type IV secretion system protein VirB10
MTDDQGQASDQPTRPQSEADVAGPFRLRHERERISRLSRKALIGVSALSLILIAGAIVWSLKPISNRALTSEEVHSTDHHNMADQLAGLPKSYAEIPRDVPRLGPPLPGDLGRPIVIAQAQTDPVAADAEQQRANQENEAARTSKVFAGTAVRPSSSATTTNEHATGGAASSDDAFAQNGQDRKLSFVNAPVDRRTTSPDRLAKAASPFVVQAGTVISAALMTGIRSDLPGQVTAQVTENVFDTPTGRFRLVPQGARLIGVYDSQVSFGQSRVLLVWTRLIMPNGRSIVLERQSGADAAGYSGLEDQVDNHWKELLGAAALSTLLGVGSELGSAADSGSNSAVLQALRMGAANSLNQTGQQVVRRNLNIQPALTIRQGFPVRVIVNLDLVLEPYRG